MSEKSEPNTSIPVQHPPRELGQVVEVGQQRQYGYQIRTVECIDEDGYVHSLEGGCWGHVDNFAKLPLISPAKPAVDRAVCNGRCMTNVGTSLRPAWTVCNACAETAGFRDARVPPLAPVETPPNVVVRDHFLVGSQPVPVAQAPVCNVRYNARGCRGEVLMRVLTKAGKPRACCETCMVAQDGQFARALTVHAEGLGEPYAGPERLASARLAHSEGIESDEWEDA